MTSDSERPALQLDIDTLVGDGVRARTMAALFGEDDASPTSIGAYQIHGVIGRGGMGVVYRATDAALNRTVAIKRVLPERANPGRDDRLLEEARQLARIQHPNVVEVFEVGEHKGSPYLVLEYVPGPSLQQWLTTEEHTPQQVYAMFLQAGRGLAAAHARDVVHLDFKPANVLVAPGSTAKVADFGLAQLFARDTTRCASETGTDLTLSRAAGTPAYMAPEQFRGRVSAKADQFAFAVSMLQALSGHHPLEGAVAASQEPQEAAARLRSVRCKGTPRHAVAALRRACAHDPEQRWPSLAALLDVLEARSHRDWRTAAVFASSVLTAGLLAWFAGGSVRPPSCVELSEEAAQAWGSAARDQVVEALRSADAPGPSAGQGFILAQLDAAAESWAEQRRDACEAMRAGGGLDDATLDRRFACLDATREAIASAAAFARDAPQRVLLRPQALTASLPEPSGCLQDERLRSGGPPVPAAAQPQVASVRRTLVRAHILHELQDFEAASEALDDAELQLRSLDYAPLRAQLDRQRGSLALSELDYPEAQLRLEAAFDSANALGMVELACEAALDLAFLFGSEAGVPADNAERWLHHAAALSERGGDELSLRLSTTRAAVAQGRGDLEDALVYLNEALAKSSSIRDPLGHAKHLNNLSIVLRQLGRFDAAQTSARAGWELNEATLGALHPLTLASEVRLANVLRMQGRSDDARLHAEHAFAGLRGRGDHGELEASSALGNILSELSDPRACAQLQESAALAQRLLGSEHTAVDGHRLNLAGCFAKFGDLPQAVQLLEQVVERFERAGSPNLPTAQHGLADILLRLAAQRPEPEATTLRQRAEGLSDRSVAATVAARGPDTPLQVGALEVRGRALLELGRPAEALGLFERVVALRDPQRPEMSLRVALLLQIARWETANEDPDRLREARDAAATQPGATTAWIDGWLSRHGFARIDIRG